MIESNVLGSQQEANRIKLQLEIRKWVLSSSDIGVRRFYACCTVGWVEWMTIYFIFQKCKRKDLEYFHHEEMVMVWGDICFNWFKHYKIYTFLHYIVPRMFLWISLRI
jgi:hypothetical protein